VTPQAPAPLRSFADIHDHFTRARTALRFVNPTNSNLYGAEQWLPGLRHLVAVDGYDGRNARIDILEPRRRGGYGDLPIEHVNDLLLSHPGAREYFARAGRPRLLLMMFGARTEQLARELGLEICFPSAALRESLDDKIATVRLGQRAGVPSVPNVLCPVRSYDELRARAGHLGDQLVVQTAFGYSGHSTFFIASPSAFDRHAGAIAAAGEVKVMRRIRALSTAIEGCTTAHGVVVGPLMTELIGHPALTPHPGGWCGNELGAGLFTAEIRSKARRCVERVGGELWRIGYRGYFELDLLIDQDDGSVYLGELNPRLTGASPMTNLSRRARDTVPLYLFHLLEWFQIPFDIDLQALNAEWEEPANDDGWSQLIIGPALDDEAHAPSPAPRSGVWRLAADGRCRHLSDELDREAVSGEDEGFLIRTVAAGDSLRDGTVFGRLMLRGRAMTGNGELTDRATAWAAGITAAFAGAGDGA
jgi:hypothetical protein